MKAIRRSLKGGDKDSKAAQHLSITPKSAVAIIPPKKVIKALYDYAPETKDPQQLAFQKGDFFHVISREDDPDWYEACNPTIPSARGLVPVAYFEVIGRTERRSAGSSRSVAEKQENHDSGFSNISGTTMGHNRSDSTNTTNTMDTTNTTKAEAQNRMSGIGKGASAMVYGIVEYDFTAERPDELEAKKGEAIIVIAQSTPEWFVAKPIGRLGGPGLIPVSFVQLKDMATGKTVDDPHEAVQRAGVPRVEEWKKMAADYKNSSISLGRLDSSQPQLTDAMARLSMNNAGSQSSMQSANGSQGNSQNHTRESAAPQLLAPISATLPRYCFDNDMYWYIIECQMEDGRLWELSRFYADFYDFQISLLEAFPEEAGNKGKPRTLPYMPGPVAHVTDAISNGRRQNLDEYIRKILSMPPHISKCSLVRTLFAPRPGDFEIDPSAIGEDYRLSGTSQQSSHEISRNASRQSSSGQMNGVPTVSGMPPPTSRAPHQRGQSSLSAAPAPNGGAGLLQAVNRQPSSLTQASAASSQNANPGGAMKVKVFFQEDIIAIRVPQDIAFPALRDKLKDRLKVTEDIIIQYKDEMANSYASLDDDSDLDTALQRSPKLTLYVNFVS